MNTSSPFSRFAKFVGQFKFAVEGPSQDRLNSYHKNPMFEARWTGKVGYVELGSVANAVARIELDEQGYQGNWSAFRVEIIHRVNGKLDSLTFSFNELMDPKDRTSNGSSDHKSFHGWASNGGHIWWYIAEPTAKNIKRFDAAVNEYLKMWVGSDLPGTR